jgi:hypothetical protein
MLAKCCGDMTHYEHMCSLNLNGCAIEKARSTSSFECSPCDDTSHNHRYVCTPSLFGT